MYARSALVALCVSVGSLCGIASDALADSPNGSLPPIPAGAQHQNASPPTGSPGGQTAGGGGKGAAAPGGTATGPTPAPSAPRPDTSVTKRCRTRHGKRTCRYYRAGTLIRTCVRKRGAHRYRCKAAAATAGRRTTPQPQAKAATTSLASGFVSPQVPSIVRVYFTLHNGSRHVCSGSVLLRGVILTAGHCVFSNGPDGRPPEGDGTVGYYDVGSMLVVPGNDASNGQTVAPYGAWTVRNAWTTSDYGGGSLGGDWGLVEVNPNSAGQYPGDVVGELNAEWNYSFPNNDEYELIGYPTAGVWGAAQNGAGNRQGFCYETWNPDNYTAPEFGGYYAINSEPCILTAGASGGPEFAKKPDGSWVIVAVNNRGGPNDSQGFGQNMLGFWFDGRFGTFYNSVIGLINAGN